MTFKYEHELDFRSTNNSHVQLLSRVREGARVLELGCATGYMSAYLAEEKGCAVVGVDIAPEAVAQAASHCVQTLCADVETPGWSDALGEQRFDVVLCADIIEHLKDPETFLAGLVPLFADEGKLLASVPNGAHAVIRLELLQGQFTYEDTGLLDRTHLHLFTHQSLLALLGRAGYVADALNYTFHVVADEVIENRLRHVGLEPTPEAVARLQAPEASAFQFIVEAHPRAAGEVAFRHPELLDKPLVESEEVYRSVHNRLNEAQLSAQELHEVNAGKQRQLERLERQLEGAERQLAAAKQRHQEQLEHREKQLAAAKERFEDQLERRDQQVARKEKRIEALAAQRTELEGQLRRLERQVASKDGRLSELQHRANLLDMRVASLRETRLRQDAVIARQRMNLAQQKKHLAQLRARHATVSQRHAEAQQLLTTRSWRTYRLLTSPFRAVARLVPYFGYLIRHPGVAPQWTAKAVRIVRQGGLKGLRWHLAAARSGRAAPKPSAYRRWITEVEAKQEPAAADIETFVRQLDDPPTISIVMPVYDSRAEWLEAAIESVLAQTYPHWQLCIADDASPSDAVHALLRRFAAKDERIRVVFRETNGHISAASNSALAVAEGAWVGFMDHDDQLAPNALYHVAKEIVRHPEAQLLYSDEDKLNAKGQRYAHYFKPDFNPDLMLSHNLVCHFSVYRRALVERLGGLREGFEGAQDYDLALRCVAAIEAAQIRHIPRILYHWRAVPGSTATASEEKPYALQAAVKAVQHYLEITGAQAEVQPSLLIDGMLRVKYSVPDPAPLVSVIIPTRNGLRLLRQCVDSIREKTSYPSLEILIVDNQSDDPATLEYLEALAGAGEARVIAYDKPFNYAAINNVAVEEAKGDHLCFMNNDIEVIDGDWLSEMVSHAARPEIGAVGARLLYPDGRLQHGGVITGLGGVAGHAMKYLSGESKGYNGRAVLVQNYSAVTAACLVVRREVFDEVGGFDAENLGVAFNDVDLCLRIREQGYRNLWTPYAELYHHESATRGPEDTDEKQARFTNEIGYMKSRWGDGLLRDPAYNPNLTLDREDFSLNWYGQA